MALGRTLSRAAWALALTLFAQVSIAHAEEPPAIAPTPLKEAPPAALDHYARGREYFRAGHYRQAIVELKTALALDPSSANLLYNVAYTSELLGDIRGAIDYYRKYLTALPAAESQEREKVRVTLRRLEGRLAEHPAATSGTTADRAAAAHRFGRADLLFWSSLGTGAALLAGGTVTGVLALQREHEVKDFVAGKDGSLARRNSLIDQTHSYALTSDILMGAGAAFVVAAGLLFVLREPRAEQPSSAAPTAALVIDAHAAILTLHSQF